MTPRLEPDRAGASLMGMLACAASGAIIGALMVLAIGWGWLS